MLLKLLTVLAIPFSAWGNPVDPSCPTKYQLVSSTPAPARHISKWELFRKGEPVSFPSDPQFQPLVRQMIRDEVAAYGLRMNLSQDQIDLVLYRVETAFDEVFSNALEHGNSHNRNRNLSLRLQMRDGTVKIVLGDESGEFFDPSDSSHPVQRDGLRALSTSGLDDAAVRAQVADRRRNSGHAPRRRGGEGGFGVAVTEALADKTDYHPHIIAGNVVGTAVELSWNLNPLRPSRSRLQAP